MSSKTLAREKGEAIGAVVAMVILFALVIYAAVGLDRLRAQAVEAHPTQIWTAVDFDQKTTRRGVSVIDTPGVCLYVVRDGNSYDSHAVAIAAVPKAQLPAGKGCQ
jgi:hypothetical protein